MQRQNGLAIASAKSSTAAVNSTARFALCDIVRASRNTAGVAAVEFALIVPLLISVCFGIVIFSFVLSTYNALQQISAEAARAGLPGISAQEQALLANQYVSSVMNNYGFIDPHLLTVSTISTSSTFQVSLSYDASNTFFGSSNSYFPTPLRQITSSATVQIDGF